MRIYLDAGHGTLSGGIADSGAAANGLRESDLTLDIALRAKAALLAAGATVKLSRRSNDTPKGLRERAAEANGWGAQLVASVHINSAAAASANGVEVLIARPGGEAGRMARAVHDEVCRLTGMAGRGIKLRPELAILRLTDAPALLLEAGFISNPAQAARLGEAAFRQLIAEGIASALTGGRDTVNQTTVLVGDGTAIPARLIDGVTYVPLRDIVEAVRPRVVWSPEDGARVIL